MAYKTLIFVLFLFLFLVSVPKSSVDAKAPSKSHVLIYEVSPYSYSNAHMDYVCLVNPTKTSINLDGYALTDFEGKIWLNGTLKPWAKMYVAENATAFERYMGFTPNLTYSSNTGKFALSNSGDEAAILHNGKIVDLVIYGNSKYNGTGWCGEPLKVYRGHVFRRVSFKDTDSPVDWSNYHRIGQSAFSPIIVKAPTELFVYPDDVNELYRYISNARQSLDIEVYTLSSLKVEQALEQDIKRGVNVTILLEGSPVGGLHDAERYVIQRLYMAGAKIFFMENIASMHNRYDFVHSKFIIRDGKAVLISTENMDMISLSPCGNRGYGIIMRSSKLAAYFLKVFNDDVKRVQDIHEYAGEFTYVAPPRALPVESHIKKFNPANLTASISTVLAPDYSLSSFNNFVNAEKSVDVEALYLKDYALAMVYPKASRILVQEPESGYHMREFRQEGIKMLHAKLLIGDNAVLVGSMNFGRASITKNREVSVIISGKDAVHFFEDVFNYDWYYHNNIAVMRITTHENEVFIDLRDTVGRVKSYSIYIDKVLRYSGTKTTLKFKLGPGEHNIKCLASFEDGTEDVVIKEVSIARKIIFEPEYVFLFLVFAVFLYKLWQNHG